MKLFIQLNCFLAWTFKCSFAWRETPRLILSQAQDNTTLRYPIHQNHTVFFHPDDSDDLYVGGTGFVFQMDVQNCRVIEEFTLNTTGEQTCTKGPCENVITVIQHFQDSLFVCGTNGHKPQCWKLYSQIDNQTYQIVESYEGIGISPHIYIHNSVSLTVEGDLYTAAPLDSDGSSLQFRRIAGSRTNVWMYDTWVSEPTFISANWIKRSDDPKNEKIYVFFREKNSDNSPEADPWISRVARVCKIDEGGPKRFFQNIWTSFLKARLVCGIPKESLYFNRLQDIYVLHSENWEDSRVYGLFTSSWNSTAVCIYSMKDIDNIFENSTFKGFDKEIPNPRPGKCVSNSKNLPLDTINVVKDHPEMSDWIHSIRPHVPFYISSNNYTKIAVDQVQAADKNMHNVLLLATDSGKIHKVLEDGSEPFIISEIQPVNHSAIIRSIKLESAKRKLVVGFSEQITVLDLESCQDYNKSCEDCVLARDPYCAWSKYGCTPTVLGSIQNILDGRTGMCPKTTEEPKKLNRTKRETRPPSSEPLTAVHEVPPNSPFYLSCPIDSYHAVYTWEQGGHSKPCLPMQANCLHLIPAMAPEHYGEYKCVSKERDYNKTVKAYQLSPSRNLRSVSILNGSRGVKAETAQFHFKTLLSILTSFFLTSRLRTCMLPC